MSHLNTKFWKNKKIYITGHTGFKGAWLCIILNLLKSKIYGYALKPSSNSLFEKSKIKKNLLSNTYSDINNLKKLKQDIKNIKPEIVFHLAAQPLVLDSYRNPLKTFNTNVMGTINLLESIKNIKSIKSVIIITTDKVYKVGIKNKSYSEDDELGGIDPYSASKASAELAVNSYIRSFYENSLLKNRVSTARAGNVIGGGDYSKERLLPDIIKSIKNKATLKVRNPNSVRPWQHVIDPLVGYLILAQKQYSGMLKTSNYAWNFGPNKNNFKKVIDIIEFIKKKQKFKYTLFKTNRDKETKILKLNSKKSKQKLKWSPKWNLKKTLDKIIEWNLLVNKGISAKKVCEKQFLMYINK